VRRPRTPPSTPKTKTEAAAAQERVAAVLRAVRRIPRGRVATYGDVARAAGLPGRARLAGRVLRDAPASASLPWHRVVGAGGRLSVGAFAPHAALTQRLRLEREGVRFTRGGRVDLRSHRVDRPAGAKNGPGA
jgi:methylated-DNA-protein-cysteine methyltransferase-like protein